MSLPPSGPGDDGWLDEVWPHPCNSSGITRLELACGWVTGLDARGPDIAEVDPLDDPLVALDRALLPSLLGSPCCIAFSGGRDSSVLLAAATVLARREGLPDPVAVTQRWPGLEDTDERAWQEQVIKQLGLNDWQIIDFDDDMDLLGEVATSMMLEHGLLWPPAAHGLLPLYQAATGGALVLGDGGDQIFGGWRRAYLADVLARRRRPVRHDLRGAAKAAAPRSLRTWAEARRIETPAPWLDPPTLRAWRVHQARAAAEEPLTWPGFLRWTRRERAAVLMLETWSRIGRGVGTELATPFWDPVFMRSLGVWGGRFGRGTRTSLMAALFSGLLPEAHLRRETKARFTRGYFSNRSRRFAEDWAGKVPYIPEIDSEVLRQTWLSELPPTTSAVLLQASWLLSQEDAFTTARGAA